MFRSCIAMLFVSVWLAAGQQTDLKQRPVPDAASASFQVDAGTHILLRMVNAVSTRQAQVGDRLYLETAYPIFSSGRMLIPEGSWVMGTVSAVTRPQRRKGGQLQIHFDSITLPNGVSRKFHSDLGAIDPTTGRETLDPEKSTVKNTPEKTAGVDRTIETTTAGTVVGAAVGAAAGHAAAGAVLGAGGGLAAGIATMMLQRGPDALLPRGSTVEMVLDRPLTYESSELAAAKSRQ